MRELYGLTLYREGRWREAVRELGAYAALSGSVDQHPVLADCYRALGRPEMVAELWEELRRASPGVDLLTEGLLVLAGTRADEGDLRGAISLLEQRLRPVRHPTQHHVRLWYALADLYERSGDLPAARRLFGDVARADPELGSVAERLAALA